MFAHSDGADTVNNFNKDLIKSANLNFRPGKQILLYFYPIITKSRFALSIHKFRKVPIDYALGAVENP